MSSPIRALSPGSSLSSYDFFCHSRDHPQSSSRSHRASSSEESDDSCATLSEGGSSDDEVLLSFSDLSSADFRSQRGDPRTPAVFSDDEFVLMSRPLSPESDDLTTSFSALSMRSAGSGSGSTGANSQVQAKIAGAPKRRNRKRRAAQSPSNHAVASDSPNVTKVEVPKSANQAHQSPSKARRKERRAAARVAAPSPTPPLSLVSAMKLAGGLGDRPIVDDVSEAGSEYSCIPPELYQSAQRYVSSVLADPAVKAEVPKLEFLQALIIELGLYTSLPSLPNSMRAAKALLKSQVFLNVRDYLAVRTQGVEALRNVMHPSRSALMREIRDGKRVRVKSVKDSGLGVLLVTCYH